MTENQWYTNKEIFEMFQKLAEDLSETRIVVQRYNGLVEKLYQNEKKTEQVCVDVRYVSKELIEMQTDVKEICRKVNDFESVAKGKNSAWATIREWTPWVIAIATVLFAANKGGLF